MVWDSSWWSQSSVKLPCKANLSWGNKCITSKHDEFSSIQILFPSSENSDELVKSFLVRIQVMSVKRCFNGLKSASDQSLPETSWRFGPYQDDHSWQFYAFCQRDFIEKSTGSVVSWGQCSKNARWSECSLIKMTLQYHYIRSTTHFEIWIPNFSQPKSR